jgi:hypothetical protein
VRASAAPAAKEYSETRYFRGILLLVLILPKGESESLHANCTKTEEVLKHRCVRMFCSARVFAEAREVRKSIKSRA